MRQFCFAFRASIFASAMAAVVALGGATPQAFAEKGPKTASIRLSPAELPADRDGAAMLYVPAAGRYAIRVEESFRSSNRARRHARRPDGRRRRFRRP